MTRYRRVIETYHGTYGYRSLPDILWKSGMAPLIEDSRPLKRLLREASTTRSAKKSSARFVRIASLILALESLESGFAGWGAIYQEAARSARRSFDLRGLERRLPLMRFYLRPLPSVDHSKFAMLAMRRAD
jgi:hypothetical protein